MTDRSGARGARRRAAAVAGHTGDVETARALFDDPEPDVRATALGALARVGSLAPGELLEALSDPDAGVRRRAVTEWGRHPDLEPRLSLRPLLVDPEATVVEAAAWAAGEILGRTGETGEALDEPGGAGEGLDEPDVVADLATIARNHDDPLCREAAVAALGAIGDTRGLPAILHGTGDKPAVRRRAVLALAPFEGPEVDAALARALEDRDWQVRQAAEDLLGPPH